MKMTLQRNDDDGDGDGTADGDNGSQNESFPSAQHPPAPAPSTVSGPFFKPFWPLFRFAYSHMHNILDLFALLALLCVSSALKDLFRSSCRSYVEGLARLLFFWPFDMQK